MFKKFLSTALCLSMLLTASIQVFANNITTDGGVGSTVVSYGMDEGFLVIIPGDFTISGKKATADVSAQNVMLGANKTLSVIIHGDDYEDKWELIDEDASSNRLEYTIGSSEGGTDIVDGSIVLAVDAGDAYNSSVTETMHFTIVDTLTKSGTYNDTLTFEVRVSNSVLEGNGQTFYRVAPSDLSFRSLAPLDEFQTVLVNGQPLDESNYTLTEGSTIVTLGVDYLKTLGGAVYDIEIVSDMQTSQGQFNVDEGDWNSEVGFWYNKPYIMALNGAGVGIMMNKNGFLYFVSFDLSSNVYTIEKQEFVISNRTLSAMGYTLKGTDDEHILDVWEDAYPKSPFQLQFFEPACLSEGEYFYAEPWAAFTGTATDYDAQVLDRDKTSYQPILSGINGVVVETNGTYRDCVNLKEITIPLGITFVGVDCFENCTSLEKIVLPVSIEKIHSTAFTNCTSLTTIKFNGTMEDWNSMTKETGWNNSIPATTVQCTDGIVELN